VRPPRLAATPVQMECRLDQVVTLGRGVNTLYIGEVVAFHLSRDIYDGNRVDSARMRPVARLGGPFYAALGEIIHRPMLQRPPGGEGWTGDAPAKKG
jgi:flavin reductase (DIM6/NTAB) family NADH-FMN oxidoreductase RutF